MQGQFNQRPFIYFCVVLLAGTAVVPLSSSQTVSLTTARSEVFTGQILFAPMYSSTTYLIDNTGIINHSWSSSNRPYYSVYMADDGTICRTYGIFTPTTAYGGIEKFSKDGTVIWRYEYYSHNEYQTHHDFKPLPNGNILMIGEEIKTRSEAIAAGRNPVYIEGDTLLSDFLVEIEPTGPTSGDIVWEWHVWDHLIQDFDKTKGNYGVVANHPELLDINFVQAGGPDWLHCNSVAYNEKFDQVMISFRNLNEIWIIDHSTTTLEAKGHTGGNFGKGGDVLYRWGNPKAYRAGTASDQKLFGQHDATWIKPKYPGEGNILIFNNGVGRGYSSVDEIEPPMDAIGNYILQGSSYGPANPTWIYTANPPTSFYAEFISGAQRLPNGNTLICDGPIGRFFEVTPGGTTIWSYVNPYPNPSYNDVFKIQYIPFPEPEPHIPNLECTGSLSWTNVQPGVTKNGYFTVQNIGNPDSLLNWTIDTSSLNWGTWSFSPESGTRLTPEDGEVTVIVSVVAPSQKNTEFKGYIRVENQDNASDFAIIPVSLKTQTNAQNQQIVNHHVLLQGFLQRHSFVDNHIFLRIFLRMIHSLNL